MLLLPLRLDLAPHLVHRLILYFNPRTPVRCDMRYHSITPVRCNFNPRTPVGCAPRAEVLHHRVQISIHAPQWGATRTPSTTTGSRCYFNPRTPVGCDLLHSTGDPGHRISIHAPQWGATSPAMYRLSPFRFQSTHPSGVRPSAANVAGTSCHFNPRTP